MNLNSMMVCIFWKANHFQQRWDFLYSFFLQCTLKENYLWTNSTVGFLFKTRIRFLKQLFCIKAIKMVNKERTRWCLFCYFVSSLMQACSWFLVSVFDRCLLCQWSFLLRGSFVNILYVVSICMNSSYASSYLGMW